mgnify:FL=1|tara:strand:+ start:281 stop:685 length:405 start_codon:yes stop_codon:yes gene_type:complete
MDWKRFSATVPGVVAGSQCAGFVAVIPLPPVAVIQSPIESLELTLFSRQGCCLCEGLEQRLKDLDLSRFEPPLNLEVIDIDGPGIDPELRIRYDLEVPVLALQGKPLPRVSPRLSGEGLFNWLQRLCSTIAGSD